jgi:hypothetical protein
MEDEILRRLILNISSNNPSVESVKRELEKISNRGRSEWDIGKSIIFRFGFFSARTYHPLFSAVLAKRKDLIKLMVEDLGLDIDSRDVSSRNSYHSALSTAIENNNEDMIRFLVVEMKATVNINYCRARWPSPLICAIEFKEFQIVKLFIEEFGADVNFKVSHYGSDPFLALHWAIYNAVQRLVFC